MSRVWLLIAVLATSLLAGCTGPASDEIEHTSTDEPVVVNDPTDYSYLQNQSGDRAHLHDYWGGKEALVVLEKTESMGVLVIEENVEVGAMKPDAGTTVLLGTARVEVTVEWADHPPVWYGPMELWVKTARMVAPEPVGVVQSGDTLTIETTNEDNDLPHQTLSGWVFALVARPAEADPGVGLIQFAADVTMTAIAYRGLDIPLFPAHPDHWGGTDRLVLVDQDVEVLIARGGAEGQACLAPCLELAVPRDGSIVPPETEVVEFVVGYEAGSTQRLAWVYHGGDSWDWQDLVPTEDDGTTYTYRIALGRAMADGPYAKQSLWEFHPLTPGGFGTVDPDAPSDGAYTGRYHVTMTALRGPAAR